MEYWHSALTLLGLGGLIFLHELGHYWMAVRCKMRVEEFSIGLGWSVFSWRFQNVQWHLRCLPLGGFVRIAGMDADVGQSDEPGTYSGSTLINRVLVIMAGPLVNVLTALVLFSAIFALGGRYKSLAEVNSIIGWIDPQSALYHSGLRPGDRILTYDALPFTHMGDHVTAATFGGESLFVEGEKIDYDHGTVAPFSERISLGGRSGARKGMRSTGVVTGAGELIFVQCMSLHSPLAQLDLHAGDRLLWANGERLFSVQQLAPLLDNRWALITFERDGHRYNERIAKVEFDCLAGDEGSKGHFEGWRAWRYDAGFGASQAFSCIPYALSSQNRVVRPLQVKGKDVTYSHTLHAQSLEENHAQSRLNALRSGDRILAVDGCPTTDPESVARLLQTKHLALIVERGLAREAQSAGKLHSAQGSDGAIPPQSFLAPLMAPELRELSAGFGRGELARSGKYCLLPPVEITPLKAQLSEKQLDLARKQHRMTPDEWDQRLNARVLGGAFRDLRVRVNQNPISALTHSAMEPLKVLWGLLTGRLGLGVVSGPLGIMRVIYRSWSESLTETLFWLANISMNLALFNLLPIPVLDGGHLLFACFEKMRGRPVSAMLIRQVTYAFALILGALSLYIFILDLMRIFLIR